MKKVLFFGLFLSITSITFAQRQMQVWQDGVPTSFAVAEVDSVTFINRDLNNDSCDIIGTWEISEFVYYLNKNDIQTVDTILPRNNGKSLCFEKIDGCDKLLLTLRYVNILNTFCALEKGNSIKVDKGWGGTEVFDCSGNEEKIIDLLNAIDLWVITNGNLYLINSKSTSNYNALCLKK